MSILQTVFNFLFSASSTFSKYTNSQNQNVFDHMPNTNSSAILPYNPFNNKTAALLSSTNAHSNFMYANWIDVQAKIPDQTNYLFCLQGNWFLVVHTNHEKNEEKNLSSTPTVNFIITIHLRRFCLCKVNINCSTRKTCIRKKRTKITPNNTIQWKGKKGKNKTNTVNRLTTTEQC